MVSCDGGEKSGELNLAQDVCFPLQKYKMKSFFKQKLSFTNHVPYGSVQSDYRSYNFTFLDIVLTLTTHPNIFGVIITTRDGASKGQLRRVASFPVHLTLCMMISPEPCPYLAQQK